MRKRQCVKLNIPGLLNFKHPLKAAMTGKVLYIKGDIVILVLELLWLLRQKSIQMQLTKNNSKSLSVIYLFMRY